LGRAERDEPERRDRLDPPPDRLDPPPDPLDPPPDPLELEDEDPDPDFERRRRPPGWANTASSAETSTSSRASGEGAPEVGPAPVFGVSMTSGRSY